MVVAAANAMANQSLTKGAEPRLLAFSAPCSLPLIPLLRLGEAICGDAFPLTNDALTEAVAGQASKQVFYCCVSRVLVSGAWLGHFDWHPSSLVLSS